MNAEKKLFKTINNSILKSSVFFLIAACVYITLSPKTNFAATVINLSASTEDNFFEDETFDKKFREGRDLIDRGEWARAAEKFNEVIGKYPGGKSIDAALYWLAFSYKKQKQFKETDAALDRLLKEFPGSSWADDARVMKMEIGLSLGKIYSVSSGTAYSTLPSQVYKTTPSKTIVNVTAAATIPKHFETALEMQRETYNSTQKIFQETYNSAPKTSLDREDEIKIAAFQSLLAADPKRALEVMSDILTPDSKASETLKQEVLRVLRSPRLLKGQSFTFAAGGIDKQFTPLLRETLIKSFQKEPNIKIRKEIIYALASLADDQSANYLGQLYASENNKEIKKAIINSFGRPAGGFIQYGSAAGNLFAAASNSISNRKIEFDKLFEIVGKEKDIELRRLAFSNLQRFGKWSENAPVLDMIVRLYDEEIDEEFKISIIRAFAAAKQNQASKKLLDIAKNDKSDKLKLEAIYALRTSSDPEALKFLEDLIK